MLRTTSIHPQSLESDSIPLWMPNRLDISFILGLMRPNDLLSFKCHSAFALIKPFIFSSLRWRFPPFLVPSCSHRAGYTLRIAATYHYPCLDTHPYVSSCLPYPQMYYGLLSQWMLMCVLTFFYFLFIVILDFFAPV